MKESTKVSISQYSEKAPKSAYNKWTSIPIGALSKEKAQYALQNNVDTFNIQIVSPRTRSRDIQLAAAGAGARDPQLGPSSGSQ